MARDYYCSFPLDLPALPTVRTIRRKLGPKGVLMYYDMRIAAAQCYQYNQHLMADDVVGMAADWDMTDDEAKASLVILAHHGLINAEALAEGWIGIEDVADRATYIAERSECGKRGGRKKKADQDSAQDGS